MSNIAYESRLESLVRERLGEMDEEIIGRKLSIANSPNLTTRQYHEDMLRAEELKRARWAEALPQ